MAWQINITFQNDGIRTEARDAFAEQFGWRGSADPRGGTKAAFMDWCIKQYVRSAVRNRRVREDRLGQAARIPDPDVS